MPSFVTCPSKVDITGGSVRGKPVRSSMLLVFTACLSKQLFQENCHYPFQARIVLKLLVLLKRHLVACSWKIAARRQKGWKT